MFPNNDGYVRFAPPNNVAGAGFAFPNSEGYEKLTHSNFGGFVLPTNVVVGLLLPNSEVGA